MRHACTRVLQALALLLFFASLGGETSALAAKDPQTPEEMYEFAVKRLDRGDYIRAVEMFERIKTRYPFSKYAVLSELRVGDAHFKKREYLEAVDAYRNFIKLHPKHPELDYVVYRIGLAQFSDAPTIAQRDQSSTRRMLATLQTFVRRFPDSQYVDEVRKIRLEGRERLAKGIYGIGVFYYRRGRFEANLEERIYTLNASIARFEQVLDEYPDAKDLGAISLYYVGRIHLKLDQPERAAETLERMRLRFPDSKESIAQLSRYLARHAHGGEARRSDDNAPEPSGDGFQPSLEPEPARGEAPPPPKDGFTPVLEPEEPANHETDVPPPPKDDFTPVLEPEEPANHETDVPPPPKDDFTPTLE